MVAVRVERPCREILTNWRSGSSNLKMFNKSKSQVLHLGWGNPGYTYRLRDVRLEGSSAKRGLRVLVLNVSHSVCSSSAKAYTLEYIRPSTASRQGEGLSHYAQP